MKKLINVGRLQLELLIYHKDFRKWNKPWTWAHNAMVGYTRFCGMVIDYRLFAVSIYWRHNHKGYELYNIEFIPKKNWGKGHLPYWDTWKVRNREELMERLAKFDNANEDYSSFQYGLISGE